MELIAEMFQMSKRLFLKVSLKSFVAYLVLSK